MTAGLTKNHPPLGPLVFSLSLILFAGTLHAQEAPVPTAPVRRTHNIQTSPLGLLLGTYSLGYENLRRNAHGFFLELLYADGKDLNGNQLKMNGYVFNYRYHLKRQMNSNFIGFYFRRSELDGVLEVDEEKFAYHFRAASVGPLYGSCHIFKNGVSFTWRVGYGVPFFDFAWSAGRPAHHGLYEGIFKWTSNVESGLSLGYSF